MATAQELVTASSCFDCGISDGQKLAVLIYLFGQSAGVSMTAQELVAASACYNCGISPGQQMAVLIYLAGQIVAGGGGGGGGTGGVTCGASDPVAAPANSCTIFYRTDVVRALGWNGSAWVVLFSEV